MRGWVRCTTRAGRSALATTLIACAASCGGDSSREIRVHVESPEPFSVLDITVIDLHRRSPTVRLLPYLAGGTASATVIVRLHDARDVLVHLVGQATHLWVASRCYAGVSGPVDDAVLLAGPLGPDDEDDFDFWPVRDADLCVDPPAESSVPCDHACPASTADDCDDSSNAVHPGVREVCEDGVDQDCDGTDAPCADADGDGYTTCGPGSDPLRCDCDDTSGDVHPGIPDTCRDGVDQDCDDATCPGDNWN